MGVHQDDFGRIKGVHQDVFGASRGRIKTDVRHEKPLRGCIKTDGCIKRVRQLVGVHQGGASTRRGASGGAS